MENNSDIRRKFQCNICGDIIEQDCVLLMIRCDKCFHEPINRGDKLKNIQIMSRDKKLIYIKR